MARLLIVHHSPGTQPPLLLEAVVAGANDPDIEGVEVVVREALEVEVDEVLAADGYLLGTSANFGYMSGALKHFFDRSFLSIGGSLDPYGGAASESAGITSGRPFGLWVHGNYDTTGAVRSILSITGALGWRQSAAVLESRGPADEAARGAAYELGGTLAALLMEH